MRYETAAAIGRQCGLDLPCEFINNIELHAMNLFLYEEIDSQLEELKRDALANGVRFSKLCGDAIRDEDSEEDQCYMCQNIQAAMAEPHDPDEGKDD